MPERGVLVCHETVRRWCTKFGRAYANGVRRRRPQDHRAGSENAELKTRLPAATPPEDTPVEPEAARS
jgi:hypothetical protein